MEALVYINPILIMLVGFSIMTGSGVFFENLVIPTSPKEKVKSRILKLFKKIKKIEDKYDKEIRKIDTEIKLMPNNEKYIPIRKAKVKLIEELDATKKLKMSKIALKYKEEFPVFIVLHQDYIDEIKKNKGLLEMYKNHIREKYNKEKFIIFNIEQFRYLLGKFYYEIYSSLGRSFLEKTFERFFSVIVYDRRICDLCNYSARFLYEVEEIKTKENK